jgi:hypothetical protein
MRTSRLLGRAATLLAAPVLAVAAAAPASAATCGSGQTCEAHAYTSGGVTVVTCAAATSFVVAATIVSCYTVGLLGDVHPGSAVASGQAAAVTFTYAGGSPARSVCVGAGYISQSGVYHPPGNFVCAAPL